MRLPLFRVTPLLAAVLLLGSPTAPAMSVIAPTFDELVAQADVVVRGVVTDVQSVTFESSQGQAIKTLVTLHVERTLKGAPGETVTLSFLGGKVGRRTLTVVGMPTFQPGQREIVFVSKDGNTICPLIAAGYGRYHVRHDSATNRDYVARENDAPLTSTDEVVHALSDRVPTSPGAAMSLDSFETAVAARLGGQTGGVQP